MAKAIWTGAIGFGLVQIPVALFAAEDRDEFDMTLLDRRDFSPVGYVRTNKKTGKEVPWEDIVKGYEHAKGEYVVLTDKDFEQANVEASQQMDILDFVEFSGIDPRYINRPYYLAPQKAGKKAYALLRETLRRTGKAGVGKIVIRTRQHLAAVIASDKSLLLILLRFSEELRDESDLELPSVDPKKLGITPKELAMAEKLVGGMVTKFEPKKYKDEYHDDLLKLIHRKVKAGDINVVNESHEAKPHRDMGANVIDLSALLAKSVQGSSHLTKSAHAAGRGVRKTVQGRSHNSTKVPHRKSA